MTDLFPSPILVIDTETSGLPRQEEARIIEIGAVLIGCDCEEIAFFESLVRPNIFSPTKAKYALKVTGITAEEVFAADPEAEVYRDFRAWCDEHEVEWVTAFNIGFDKQMLERSGVTFKRWASCIMLKACDEMKLPHKNGRRGNKWPKLAEEAAPFYNVNVEGEAHRALYDARVAAEVMKAIRRQELGLLPADESPQSTG